MMQVQRPSFHWADVQPGCPRQRPFSVPAVPVRLPLNRARIPPIPRSSGHALVKPPLFGGVMGRWSLALLVTLASPALAQTPAPAAEPVLAPPASLAHEGRPPPSKRMAPPAEALRCPRFQRLHRSRGGKPPRALGLLAVRTQSVPPKFFASCASTCGLA